MKACHLTFSPSESSQETLEQLFVARGDLADGIMKGIAESAKSGNKHQRLLIGPRGIGKTHLVALIYHRVRDNPELGERLRIAWLREDPYVASYADLLLEILRKLAREYAPSSLEAEIEKVLDLADAGQKEAALERLLVDFLGDNTLLVLIENLDDLLTDLKEHGQQKLRAFIQNQLPVTMLATATSLVDAVSERSKTFYGFFRINPVEPLRVEEAATLLTRLAERNQDHDLAAAIQSQMGFARVRAIHYLAGGNPRIYVLFYDFLSRESLDDLAKPFMKLMDELTPYYQGRMSRLSPLQRRIIDVLRQLRGASTVTEISRQTMSSPQSISSQIGKLRELGYLSQAGALGRENYYELREPLMRLCLDVKEQQGRSVELFVQFLRVWYSQPELDEMVGFSSPEVENEHLHEALQRARSEQDPLQSSLWSESHEKYKAGEYGAALETLEIAIARNPDIKENWLLKDQCIVGLAGASEERMACLSRIAEMDPSDSSVWNRMVHALYESGRYTEALGPMQKALDIDPDDATTLGNYGFLLKRLSRDLEAIRTFEKAIELMPPPTDALGWLDCGRILVRLDRQDEALSAHRNALELEPRLIQAWSSLFGLLSERGWYGLVNRLAIRLVDLIPDRAILHQYLGVSLYNMGQCEEALAAFESVLRLGQQAGRKDQIASVYRALTLRNLGRTSEALEAVDHCLPTESRNFQLGLRLIRASIQLYQGNLRTAESELDDLLEEYRTQGLTGGGRAIESLIIVSSPTARRGIISVYLSAFGRIDCLGVLGQILVRSLRYMCQPAVSSQSAREWYEVWRDAADSVEEMAPALKLAEAAIQYRVERNPRALLRLPQEERGLLEPWLVNMLREEPSDIDHEMDALLRTVERRLADKEQQKAS